MTVTIGTQAPPRYPEGSKSWKIWHALHADKWLTKTDLCALTEIYSGNISPTLTDMRRTGWIEYRHAGGRLYEWRRRVVWGEPMPDIVNRTHNSRGKNVVAQSEPTATEHLEQARWHIGKAMEAVEYIERVQTALAKVRPSVREIF